MNEPGATTVWILPINCAQPRIDLCNRAHTAQCKITMLLGLMPSITNKIMTFILNVVTSISVNVMIKSDSVTKLQCAQIKKL